MKQMDRKTLGKKAAMNTKKKTAIVVLTLTAILGVAIWMFQGRSHRSIVHTIPPVKKDEVAFKIEDTVLGKGDGVKSGQTLTLHYTGYLMNGTMFDSTRYSGKPFTFKLGTTRVIQGWERGLLGMKKGGKRKLTIPPSMAYGVTGLPPAVPPSSALIYEIELIEIR